MIPEVQGSNLVIRNIYIEHLFSVNCIEKTKIKKKRPGMAHFFKKEDGNGPFKKSLTESVHAEKSF